MSVQPTPRMKQKLMVGSVLAVGVFVVYIIYNMIQISVVDSVKYKAMADENHFGSITLNANRGSIYDKNGQILAQSATVYTIFLDPNTIKADYDTEEEREAVIKKITDGLSEILGIDAAEIDEKCRRYEYRYVVVAKKVEKPVRDEIVKYANENKLRAIGNHTDTKRYYPQDTLAAAVIGFTNYDGEGQLGLESYYDDYLSGTNGRIISAVDAFGSEMPYKYEKTYEPEDGNSLWLTLDMTLQYWLEKELESTVTINNVQQRASGIIMDANTGAVLAMATYPGFDLNNPTEILDKNLLAELNKIEDKSSEEYKTAEQNAWFAQWKNKAISEVYHPGSVFKVITGSSALEERVIDLNTTFNCAYEYRVANVPMHCWTRNAHGSQNFVEAMTHSCNPAFIQIGEKLGPHLFYKYYDAYGFTSPTGVDLPGETYGTFYTEENLRPVELASSAFGQTHTLTPLQMITAYAAVINGGKLVTPYVVDKIVDANGNVIKTAEPHIVRQVISEETSQIMRETLQAVVDTNGGSNASIEGYKIGGKSGTSEKQQKNIQLGRDDLYVSSYCAFAPADNPEIIMLVMVDEPSAGDYYGSVVAAPVVKNVLEQALPYLGYYPSYTDEELEHLDVTIPNVEGQSYSTAKSTLEALGLHVPEIIGSGETVTGQFPTGGSAVSRGGQVVLYTDDEYKQKYVAVPNLKHMTLSEANYALGQLGLNLKVLGGAARSEGSTAVSQNWGEGHEVPMGTVVEVYFAARDQG